MRLFGQLCLLTAFVGSGYAAFACLAGWLTGERVLRRTGLLAASGSVVALTLTLAVLGWALVTKDFSFKYVTQYSSWLLAWHYSLAALWVGQAGSLLLWAWILGGLSLLYYFKPRATAYAGAGGVLGVLMACLGFLLAIMVFGADPMEPNRVVPKEGAGLGPLLHHPAMLVHPPVVFIGYAAWTIPFALAVAALLAGRLDGDWVQEARPWAVFAWIVLGLGILLGASWAYQELGWGGYWGWDPVENGSLIPWLTGSALIHALMAWRFRGVLKKTAVSLAIVTFGMCNFATFLTRSGIFSSVHAFSQSPIGWMFLALMAILTIGAGVLVPLRRQSLMPDRPLSSVWSREGMVLFSAILLLLLATVTTAGTAVGPISKAFIGRQITVGPAFYNSVFMPIGLLLLTALALAPALRWGGPPASAQRLTLGVSAALAIAAAALGFSLGLRHPAALAVTAAATLAGAVLAGSVVIEIRGNPAIGPWRSLFRTLHSGRRQYAGFFIHLGFVFLAIGVTASSLGSLRTELLISEGETIEWAGHSVHYRKLVQHELPDKLVAEAILEVTRAGGRRCTLRPARHLHLLQNEWTTEVAIESSWSGDFYTILNSGEGNGRVSLTLVKNPLIWCIWLSGAVMAAGAIVALWPGPRRLSAASAYRTRLGPVRRRSAELAVSP